MAAKLQGRVVEKAEPVHTVMESVEALRDFQPTLERGPGRKLGL